MTKDEALKLALEALHGFIPYLPLNDETQCGRYDKAITAIKEALAQPEQEPVAWEQFYPDMGKPQLAIAQRKPLSDEEILTYRYMIDWTAEWSYINFARAIEAALRTKNT